MFEYLSIPYFFPVMVLLMLISFRNNLHIDARYGHPEEIQNWYMKRIIDPVPLLETIVDCRCPRIYIPVCATDNKTYTNLCRMNCMNAKRNKMKGPLEVSYMGICLNFLDAFDYEYK